MSDQPLLHIEGATEGTTQWRTQTLQMINWGGFHGYHKVSLEAPATLVSGSSGTGKSSLLDGYLALMMPSDTPFNGASTDATGRARGNDQRSVLSYLRGKTDTSWAVGTGDLQDQVLRGGDGPTWGALAMTFVDDNQRQLTVLRIYFAPRAATAFKDISMRMATTDGFLDLNDLAPIAESRFDKRTLKTRFPQLQVFDTYMSFEQTLFTRLGIGANGDGSKALRLLARIQASQQVKSVDTLYKSMVLEEPATYAAADKATGHFVDLEKSYEAMVTEDQKAKVLDQIPALHDEFDTATENAAVLDMFGVDRVGDTSFVLWRLLTERHLLDGAVEQTLAARRTANDDFTAAQADQTKFSGQLLEVQKQQRENGGDTLVALAHTLDTLGAKRNQVLLDRAEFNENVAPLSVPVDSAQELATAKTAADRFMKAFESTKADLADQHLRVLRETVPLEEQVRKLATEKKSLSGRDGLVPAPLHEVRMTIAQATGISAEDLPFMAELIDIAPGQERWRQAAEVTLRSAALIMLVDKTRLDHLSRTIDPLHFRRIHFQGVELQPHKDVQGDPARISGKLRFKESPFSGWVQDRVQANHTDHLCVESPTELGGGGPRVTVAGQTRDGKRGAHGETRDRNVIGFSNKARLAEITDEIEVVTGDLQALSARASTIGAKVNELDRVKEAHQYLNRTSWTTIDVVTVDTEIAETQAERDRILADSNILRALEAEEELLKPKLEDAKEAMFGAKAKRVSLDDEHADLVERSDDASNEVDRITRAQSATLSEENSARLDTEYLAENLTVDLDTFKAGIERLRRALLKQSDRERDIAKRASEALRRAFDLFQDRWPDPNLGVGMPSYSAYRDILDNILSTGLLGRREEWKRRLSEWSGEDLVPLNGAFESSIQEIIDRLTPVNEILATLPFGAGRDRLKINLGRLSSVNVSAFRANLKSLSSGTTENLTDEQMEGHFKRLREFMTTIRKPEDGSKAKAVRDNLLDVRKHVEITAVRMDVEGRELSRYSALGGKSGGETQELVAFIVGAALRFQLGDDSRTRPRFAPVFLDEGFVKADAEFAGRSVDAWKGLGFQLIIGAPLDKVTALEPYMDVVLSMTKNPKTGFSYITSLTPTVGAVA
jgi:uncharacterized protein YPO0396